MVMKDHPKYDVAIVGAGIAGSVAARLLAEKNISVLLLEKTTFSGEKAACGGLFDWPYFNRHVHDSNIFEQRIRKNVFHLPWGKVVFHCDQVTVKRRKFDRYLAEQARKAGAIVKHQQKVLSYVVQKSGCVRLEVKNISTGEIWEAHASIILLADGPKSLAHQNPVFGKQLKKRFWAYAYAYEVDSVVVPADEAHIYFAPQLYPWGYGWIFPDKEVSNVGVGAVLPELRKKPLKGQMQTLLQHFPATAQLLKKRKIVDKKGGYLPMWMLNRLSDDSQLVMGDAAGMISPLFGAGIDYAIEAAEACVPVVENALSTGDFSAKNLEAYDRAVEERFGRNLRKQKILARLILFSLNFGRLWPMKILSIVAFGVKFNRWNKIKIFFYPLLGRPQSRNGSEK